MGTLRFMTNAMKCKIFKIFIGDEDTLSNGTMESENSFMSAMSEHEDQFGLVNLHMQVNKPITDSPLLMTSYRYIQSSKH